MVKLVKAEKNHKWYTSNNQINFKVIEEENRLIIWVSQNNKNMYMALLMYDFYQNMRQEDHDFNIFKSEDGQSGFQIEDTDVFFVLGIINYYIHRWDISVNERDKDFPASDWYSVIV